ncbi:hypothetical protein [Halalkalibacter alkalisediminis]|uniref:Uncharacterized protein n=2 Tax=Halalkalibacter alkalisediminis TaxID=935616 RepID=A0ABV6NCX3_9BACI|nr:hypothetical protein [Halalkalibacter alkalisediminis]
MIKKLSSQEIFILFSAIFVLLFMYTTIILSAPINELSEMEEQPNLIDGVEIHKKIGENSSFAYLSLFKEDDHE